MVLSLLIGGVVALGIGYLLVLLASTAVHWLSIAAGGYIAFQTLRTLLQDRPFDLTGNETINNIVYAAVSTGVGFVAWKIVAAAFALAGFLSALIVAGLLVAGYFFGASTVITFIGKTLGFIITALDSGGR